jgi:hypothetical protein
MSAFGPKRTSLTAPPCPLSGVKRTWPIAVQMSANEPKADMTGSTLTGRPIVSIARSVPGFFGFTSNAPLAKNANVATAEILEA